MQWHFVNAMTYETATHRVQRVHSHHDSYWLAERKATEHEHVEKLNGHFPDQQSAEAACERDQYSQVTGR